MKAIDDEVHEEFTGRKNEIILENLRRLAADSGHFGKDHHAYAADQGRERQ